MQLVWRPRQHGLVHRTLGLVLGLAEGKEIGLWCYRNLWRMGLPSLEEAGLKTSVSPRILSRTASPFYLQAFALPISFGLKAL